MNEDLEECRRRLPLPDLLHKLGLGECAEKSSHCPCRERHKHNDKRKSFSVRFNSKTGRWYCKCFAGCGGGDEIWVLKTLFKFATFGDALAKYKEEAGLSGSATPLDWPACVEAFTDKHLEQLADWRGYTGEFSSWLKKNGFIGLHRGRIALPVHDDMGKVVAIHYRFRDGSWRYFPARKEGGRSAPATCYRRARWRGACARF
jgi:hypothetical protein